ncbi:MAG: radical SAM protein [Mariprofundaceae bacterium]
MPHIANSVPAMQSSPLPLFLPNGQALLLQALDGHVLNLTGTGETARIDGSLATSVSALAHGKAETRDRQRLAVLERQHAWLQGLSRAQTTPPQGLARTLLRSELGMLFVEVTAKCNERCIHCYADSDPDRTDFLSLDEIIAALDQAREFGRAFVQFTGGDPLLHSQLPEAVAHAAGLDFDGIEIYTNGLLLNDRLLDKLAEYQPRFSFSIYGDLPDIHDAITKVPGSWRRTLDAMRRAMQAGLEVRAGIALMPENIARAEHMSAFLENELGLDERQIRFDPVKQTGRGRFMDEVTQVLVSPNAHSSNKGSRGKLCISADGNVYPCIFARHNVLGNVRQQPLATIMTALDSRPPVVPSPERWQRCQQSLSCGDCQIISYIIGEDGHE